MFVAQYPSSLLAVNSPAGQSRLWARCLLLLLCAATFAGCASFSPQPLDEAAIRDRAETQEAHGLRVSVAVLSRDQAARVFGVNLHEHGVQPVWLEIENKNTERMWFIMHGLDPNYFSANEVAYMNHKILRSAANREMDRYFSELGIEQGIDPGQTVSGFAFSNETIGTKEVRVQLLGHKLLRNFEFFVSVPGAESKWAEKDFEHLHSAEQLIHIETDEQLREALLNLPCCTSRRDGGGEGAPINAVFINGYTAIQSLIKAGWDEVAPEFSFTTLFGADYYEGRAPDLRFSKSRKRIKSTNLIRIWLSPIRYKGKGVLVASVSRSIDPDVDQALTYLAEDLVTARTIARWGYVGGVGEVARDKPRRTFANSPYWTRGNRLVLEMSPTAVEPYRVGVFDWDWKGRRHSGLVEKNAR